MLLQFNLDVTKLFRWMNCIQIVGYTALTYIYEIQSKRHHTIFLLESIKSNFIILKLFL